METYSGLPAHSQATYDLVAAEYNKLMQSVAHLKHDPNYENLYLPKLSDFMKYDIKNQCHPMQYELLKHQNEIQVDKEESEYLCVAHRESAIPESEYNRRSQRLKVREMERQLIFNKSEQHKEDLAKQKLILEKYIEAEKAEKEEKDAIHEQEPDTKGPEAGSSSSKRDDNSEASDKGGDADN